MNTTHPHRTPTRWAILLLATLLTSALGLTPAQAAPRPVAKDDNTSLTTGTSVTVAVLRNDTVTDKTNATVKITYLTTGMQARVTHHTKIRVTAPATLPTGAYRIGYRVTDSHGKTANASIHAKVTTTATPTDPATDPTTLNARLDALPVATENRTGYSRDLFRLWIDADHDGCDTREEVLLAEAASQPTLGSGCSMTGGLWLSYYDNVATTDPSTFDIDHLVPLAEAWDSGASTWDADTRMRYANDLDDPRALVAVTASTNRSKGDQDPAEWTPPRTQAQCRYLTEWVAIKTRWSLTVDATEKTALSNLITTNSCPNGPLTVTKAKVTTTNTTPAPTGSATLTSITYDPDGDDTTLETVALTNPTYDPVNMSGWTLSDANGHTYTFPASNIAPGTRFTVRAPTGTDTTDGPSPVFYAGWGAIWNNTGGDTATLRDATGTVIDTCTYTGGARVATC